MPSAPLVDIASGNRGERPLSDAVFGVRPNPHLLYEAVRQFQAGLRRGTHATKTRAMVSGGGKKPWRQKGTGRAQVGSSRNPLWRKGGTAFGPQPRDYAYRLPGKIQRGALRSALSKRLSEGGLTVVTTLPLESPSTKTLRSQLKSIGVYEKEKRVQKVLVVDVKPSRELVLSARNMPGVQVSSVAGLTTHAVLASRQVIISEAAVLRLEERLVP